MANKLTDLVPNQAPEKLAGDFGFIEGPVWHPDGYLLFSDIPASRILLKGLIHCAHCRMPMWAQTFKNGRRYYREQKGSRGAGYCVGRSGSMPCEIPDEQMGRIISAIVLPEAWLDRVLAQVHGVDEVKRVERERDQVQQRLKRLGTAYVDGLYGAAEYRRQKRVLDDKLQSLVVPEADVAEDAGELLENLPELWEKADLAERQDAREFRYTVHPKFFRPKAPKSLTGDYADAEELVTWTRPSREVPE